MSQCYFSCWTVYYHNVCVWFLVGCDSIQNRWTCFSLWSFLGLGLICICTFTTWQELEATCVGFLLFAHSEWQVLQWRRLLRRQVDCKSASHHFESMFMFPLKTHMWICYSQSSRILLQFLKWAEPLCKTLQVPRGNSNLVTLGVKRRPDGESVDSITAVAGLMKFPHRGFMLARSVLQLGPAVFISCVNDCPACSDTVMLSDRLIHLLVSPPQV